MYQLLRLAPFWIYRPAPAITANHDGLPDAVQFAEPSMKYDFSAEFLRVQPPDTTFGDAWESLCQLLLSKELSAVTFERLRAPDGGIDIYARKLKQAYQCKANERGTLATADASAAEISLLAAISSRNTNPV